jgi:hypothetical protein
MLLDIRRMEAAPQPRETPKSWESSWGDFLPQALLVLRSGHQ